MGEKAKQAKENFEGGYNCSQSALLPFCEDYGMSKGDAIRLTCGMGGGMRSGEICGAVSGSVAAIGLKNCPDPDRHAEAKPLCGGQTGEFMARFKQEHGSLRCKDLLGCDISTPEGAKEQATGKFKAQCTAYVESAAQILEDMGL